MTRDEARREMFARWGRPALLYRSRKGRHVIYDYVGMKNLIAAGEGASWQEAFDAAEKYRPPAADRAR